MKRFSLHIMAIFFLVVLAFQTLMCQEQQRIRLSGTPYSTADKIIGPQVYDRKRLCKLTNQFHAFIYDRGNLLLLEELFEYSFTDYLGIELILPITIYLRLFTTRISNINDLGLKLLWNCYKTKYNIATFKGGIWIPTGNFFIPDPFQAILAQSELFVGDLPNTGRGTTSFTGSFTFVHNSPNWYGRFNFGGIIPAKTNRAKSGGLIFYQFTLGPKLNTQRDKTIIAAAEVNSIFSFPEQYKQPGFSQNQEVPGSGVFVGLAGPYLAYKTDRILIVGKAQWPIVQVVSIRKRSVEHYFSLEVTIGL